MQYHVDGDLHDAAEATVNVRDRGFRYGDGAVETLRLYGETLFQWDAHAGRLADTCDRLGLDHGFGRADLRARVRETVAANDLAEAVLTLSITRGVQPGGVAPDPTVDPTIVVTADPAPPGGRDGERPWDVPATVQTVRTRSVPSACGPANGTTQNRLAAVLAHQELRAMARTDPADEALLRDLDGDVVGGATSALFFVTDDGLHTPARAGGAGAITQATVTELAADEDLPVHERRIDRDDLHDAAEGFLASTRWGLRPIGAVDGIDVGGGPVTALLTSRYDGRIESACY
mgnify:CR=1 FL=1